jgi:hypothetical protein
VGVAGEPTDGRMRLWVARKAKRLVRRLLARVAPERLGSGQATKEGVVRMALGTASVIAALVACLASSPAASASPPEVGHFSGTDQFGPEVITDLPCLEGTEFVFTGGVDFRGTFVNSEDFFHFSGIEKHTGTLVPVNGQGPTYVESGNVDHTSFTARRVSTGFNLIQTHVNNDRFVGYVDGKRVASATIRIHEVEHFVGVDTNGDNVPDVFKVSVTIDRVSCPA